MREVRFGPWRNRRRSLMWLLALGFASRWAWPEPQEREQWEYLLTATVGYGHLIGAARRSLAGRSGGVAGLERNVFVATGALTGLAVYSWLLTQWAPLILVLLGLSVWHTIENDLALDRAYARGLRIGPIPRSARFHLKVSGIWLWVSALALLTPEWSQFVQVLGLPAEAEHATAGLGLAVCVVALTLARGQPRFSAGLLVASGLLWVARDLLRAHVHLADIFIATTAYHLVTWLGLLTDRARQLARAGAVAEARRARWRLVRVHAVPACICGALAIGSAGLIAAPADFIASAETGLAFAVFAPGIYLFWSALHVVQTAFARGWAVGSNREAELP